MKDQFRCLAKGHCLRHDCCRWYHPPFPAHTSHESRSRPRQGARSPALLSSGKTALGSGSCRGRVPQRDPACDPSRSFTPDASHGTSPPEKNPPTAPQFSRLFLSQTAKESRGGHSPIQEAENDGVNTLKESRKSAIFPFMPHNLTYAALTLRAHFSRNKRRGCSHWSPRFARLPRHSSRCRSLL